VKIELSPLFSNSEGIVRINDGRMKFVKGEFEGHDPRNKLFSSFRRTILCGGPGELKRENEKRGDRELINPPCFILNSSECHLKGRTEEKNSSS
jgi:hypothetical protein